FLPLHLFTSSTGTRKMRVLQLRFQMLRYFIDSIQSINRKIEKYNTTLNLKNLVYYRRNGRRKQSKGGADEQ
ncbi:MAG: hypothetical protein IKO43_04425, partial [Kiritimatiellae bacterium]|nr:hypothetical protein [Kiritimatiellia bacterium]